MGWSFNYISKSWAKSKAKKESPPTKKKGAFKTKGSEEKTGKDNQPLENAPAAASNLENTGIRLNNYFYLID